MFENDEKRKAALQLEGRLARRSAEVVQRDNKQLLKAVAGKEPRRGRTIIKVTAPEWYAATVPDTSQARAERGGLSAIDEIARRRFERMGAIPAPASPDASEPTIVAPASPEASEPDAAPVDEKPAFTDRAARAFLVGFKHSRHLVARPSDKEAKAIILRNFKDAPTDRIRKIVTDLWGPGKRGPKGPRRYVAELPD